MLTIPEQYYTLRQVAERFSVHPMTVRRWLRDGTLRAPRIKKRYFISQANLDAMLGRASGRKRTLAA